MNNPVLIFSNVTTCTICSGQAKTFDWLSYFDIVVVGCGKPAFFHGRGQLFSVDVKTGDTPSDASDPLIMELDPLIGILTWEWFLITVLINYPCHFPKVY